MDDSAKRPPSDPPVEDECERSDEAHGQLSDFEAADLLDRDLLLDFQRGEKGAFDRIVGRYEAPLWRFFYRLCWDQGRAEDFVQDVFLKVYRTAHRYESRGKLSTFLYRIATNRWIDHWRQMRPRPTLFSLEGCERDEDVAIVDRVAAPQHDPREALEEDQEKQRLRQALERLTLPHRLVFELAVYQNLPYPEIGELLDIPVGTVKSRMHNATRALKELLQDEGEDEESVPRQGRHPPGSVRRLRFRA
ncbi:MAG: sigma-70 family RNA polymerase sigma factor [Planctomycetes bacterium]|nr:sigma-70 family RNA polymerase sigma factor [Planctomycetota bacterium]